MRMSDLVEFLRARLDEDERVAQATRKNEQFVEGTDRWFATGGNAITSMAPHRAVAEVEAKRARVGVAIAVLSGNLLGVEPSGDPDIDAAGLMGAQAMAKLMLKIELMPYTKHPEYQQEWAQ